MARIAESEIERLKREVSVAAAGGGAGHQAEAARRGPAWACARSTTTATRRW